MRKRCSSFLIVVFGLMFLFSGQLAFSQTAEDFNALKKEVEAIKEGQAGLKRDIQELKKPAGLQPAAPAVAPIKDAIINIKGAPIKGDKNAKLVFIEFSDYQ